MCPITAPAAETKSIGLPADPQLSWFLQYHLDSFIVTGQILPIYRDYAVKTVLSGRENFRPSIGTLQKLMPALTQTATPHTTGPLTIIRRKSAHSAARTASNYIYLDKILFLRLPICTTTRHLCFQKSVSGDKYCNLDNFLRLPHNPANAHIKNWLPTMYC